MLLELSSARTNENELALACLCKIKPEADNVNRHRIAALIINIVRFFEIISTPLIRDIASKFANFRARLFVFLNEKICTRNNNGIPNKSIK